MGFQVAVAKAGQEDGEMQALENLLRYLDGKNVKFSTVPVALLALEAAHSYHLLGFQRHAANFLLANLQQTSVLKVLGSAFPHSSLFNKKVLTGSNGHKSLNANQKGAVCHQGRDLRIPFELDALGLEAEENEANAEQELFDQIAQRCLHLIDEHTEAVFQTEEWETIPLTLMTLILRRDTLKVSSELHVLAALDRWARMQCFLTSTPPSPSHKRRLLGPARLQARLLTLSPNKLRRAQAATGLLGPGELEACVKAALQPRCSCALPGELRGKRELLSRAREGHVVRSKDGHRHPRDGHPPQSREGQSQSRDMPLHYKESHVRSRARVPTDRLLAAGDEEEPDYASIESVDGSLQEVGVGEYRWRRGGQVGVWQRLEDPPRLREKRCSCAIVRHSYKQATVGGLSSMGGHHSSRRPSVSNGRARRLRGGAHQARRRAGTDPASLACLFYCLACVFD